VKVEASDEASDEANDEMNDEVNDEVNVFYEWVLMFQVVVLDKVEENDYATYLNTCFEFIICKDNKK